MPLAEGNTGGEPRRMASHCDGGPFFFGEQFVSVAAQPVSMGPRIGYLGQSTRTANPRLHDAFMQGLRELGWVEGKNIAIEYRWAAGRADRLPDLAAEQVRLKVDLILAVSTSVALLRADQIIE